MARMAKVAKVLPFLPVLPVRKNCIALSALFALLREKVQKVQIVQCKFLGIENAEHITLRIPHEVQIQFGGNGQRGERYPHDMRDNRRKRRKTQVIIPPKKVE